jgi:hypothetical protein
MSDAEREAAVAEMADEELIFPLVDKARRKAGMEEAIAARAPA